MAIGIDLGFVALEGAQFSSTSEKLRREVIKIHQARYHRHAAASP